MIKVNRLAIIGFMALALAIFAYQSGKEFLFSAGVEMYCLITTTLICYYCHFIKPNKDASMIFDTAWILISGALIKAIFGHQYEFPKIEFWLGGALLLRLIFHLNDSVWNWIKNFIKWVITRCRKR